MTEPNLLPSGAKDCSNAMLPIRDALEAVEGRWKLLILYSLCSGSKRFKEITKEVVGISDKTLAKELKQLEATTLIQRQLQDLTLIPIYTITPRGRSLNKVLFELWTWGSDLRRDVIGK